MSRRGPLAERLVAQAVAHRAARLERIARVVVDEGRHGDHASRARGAGIEFAEHRAYRPGDDLRQVDWRTAARSDRLVVRSHDVQRAAAAELLLDVSRSMAFGAAEGAEDVPASKEEAAAMLAAVHGYRMLRRGDAVSLTRVGEQVGPGPRRAGEGQLAALCTDIAAALPSDDRGADLDSAIRGAVARLRRPGVMLVFTDALDPDTGWIAAAGQASARGHGVGVIQVLDPAELELPHEESARFVDPENGHEVRTSPVRVRRVYRDVIRAFVRDLRRRLLDAGVDHQLVTTGVHIRQALVGLELAESGP